MAIWATVLMSIQGLHNGCLDIVFIYMITECIMNYCMAITHIQNIIYNKNNVLGFVSPVACLSVATLIWNIILLFRDVGIERIMDNPYSIYIFVQFIINMSIMGVGIIVCIIAKYCLKIDMLSQKSSNSETSETRITPTEEV